MSEENKKQDAPNVMKAVVITKVVINIGAGQAGEHLQRQGLALRPQQVPVREILDVTS